MRTAIKHVLVISALLVLVGWSFAQDAPHDQETKQTLDLLTLSEGNRSLSFFVKVIRTSGLAKVLIEENPLTVFALSNQAFTRLPKEEREILLKHPTAMHFLLAHYIFRESVAYNDAAKMSNARTLRGLKLRTEIKTEGVYVNGAKLSHSGIQCTNGVIYTLDALDPALVDAAVKLVKMEH
jgi:transforming growth factor-beta-induced protein